MEAKNVMETADATVKLFYEDSFLEKFKATVLSCEKEKNGYRVILDQTAFFPEGGGQAGDTGFLNGIRVEDTQECRGVIWHLVQESLQPGMIVEGVLDFEQRFIRMQQHTGEHIVSGMVHRLYGYDNVGFHLGDEVTTLDFNGELTKEQVEETERLANQAVFQNLPVEILYPSKEELIQMDYRSKIEIEGQVRIVNIPGVDQCACCAPHTRYTGQIGLIKILSCDRHRGGCRMVMVSGMRALSDYRIKEQSVNEVSIALSAKPEKIGEAVEHLKEQQNRLRMQLNRMQEIYLKERLDDIRPSDSYVCIFEEEMDNVAVRNFVNEAMERCDGICAAFVGTDASGYRYILGSSKKEAREAAKKLHDRFGGKGGGKPEMVQGFLQGTQKEIEQALR